MPVINVVLYEIFQLNPTEGFKKNPASADHALLSC